MKIDAIANGPRAILPSRYVQTLFRLCQEALTNSMRHGKAENVDIVMNYEEIDKFIYSHILRMLSHCSRKTASDYLPATSPDWGKAATEVKKLVVDGAEYLGILLPNFADGKTHIVEVTMGSFH